VGEMRCKNKTISIKFDMNLLKFYKKVYVNLEKRIAKLTLRK